MTEQRRERHDYRPCDITACSCGLCRVCHEPVGHPVHSPEQLDLPAAPPEREPERQELRRAAEAALPLLLDILRKCGGQGIKSFGFFSGYQIVIERSEFERFREAYALLAASFAPKEER